MLIAQCTDWDALCKVPVLQKLCGVILQGWSSSTAGKGGSGSSSSVAGGGAQAAAGEPVLDLRVVNRLLPSGASASGIPGDTFGPGDFDLEVEVEQEGGGTPPAERLVAPQQQCCRGLDGMRDVHNLSCTTFHVEHILRSCAGRVYEWQCSQAPWAFVHTVRHFLRFCVVAIIDAIECGGDTDPFP